MVDPRSKVISYVFGEAPELQEQYPRTTEVLTTPITPSVVKQEQPITATSIITAPESPRTKVISYVTERVPIQEQYPKTYETLTTPVGPSGRPPYEPRVGYRPTTYTTIYSSYNENINSVNSDIEYIRNLPPNTMLQTESGAIITRSQAITLLTRQRDTLIRDRTKIISYEQQGYVVQKDNEGNIVFRKQVEQPSAIEQARTEYQSLSPPAQVFRALIAGVTQFPTLIYNVNPPNWFITYLTKGYKQGTIDIFNIMRNTQKDIILGENKIYEAGKTGNILLTTKQLVTTPAFTDILIPYGVGKVLGPAFRTIGGIGTKAIPVVGKGAKVVQKVAEYYPYVAGGIFTGLAAGGITATLAYEQHGLVPKGSTIKQILRTGIAFGFAYAGATSSKKVIESPFQKEVFAISDKATGLEYGVGLKYFNLFGKHIYYGEIFYGGTRQIGMGEPSGLVPISQLGVSVTPSTAPPPIVPKVDKWVFKPEMYLEQPKTVESASITFLGKDITVITTTPKTFSISYVKPIDTILKSSITPTEKGGKIIDLSKISEGTQLFKTHTFVLDKSTLRKTPILGIIEVKPTSISVSDFVGTQAFGSFRALPEKPLLVSDITKPYYSKDYRMFYETGYAKSMSVSKQMGGEEIIPTKYGLETVKTPEYSLSVSKGLINDETFYKNIGITVKQKPKPKEIKLIGDTTGLTTQQKTTYKTIGDILSGISVSQFEGKLNLESIKTFPSMVSKKGIRISTDTGTEPVSDFWKNVKPTREQGVQPLVSILKTDLITNKKIIYGSALASKTDIGRISLYETIVRQDIKLGTNTIVDSVKKQDKLLTQDTVKVRVTNQQQKQLQTNILKQDLLQQYGLKTIQIDQLIIQKLPPPPPIKLFDIDLEIPSKKTPTGKIRSYYVLTKPFMDWPYQRVSGPLSKQDALNTAHTLVGGHKQASFKLQPSSDKPIKSTGKQERYQKEQYYYNKNKDIYVEKNKYRINSKGEINEITMKGIEARTKGIRMKGLII